MSDKKTIPEQVEIPRIEVYRNDEGDICIFQDQDSSGIVEAQIIHLDNARAILLAIALIDTVKGE